MKTNNEIEQLANQTLRSIDNLQLVEANAFLFAKIQARMQDKNHNRHAVPIKILFRLSAVLVLFICLNVGSYLLMVQKARIQTVQQKTTGIDAFAKEYDLTQSEYHY